MLRVLHGMLRVSHGMLPRHHGHCYGRDSVVIGAKGGLRAMTPLVTSMTEQLRGAPKAIMAVMVYQGLIPLSIMTVTVH